MKVVNDGRQLRCLGLERQRADVEAGSLAERQALQIKAVVAAVNNSKDNMRTDIRHLQMVRIEGLTHGLVEPVPRQLSVTDDQTVDG